MSIPKTHAIIELFGHTKLAGFIEPIENSALIQVTIPKTRQEPEFTKFINEKAIYAITLCSEEIAQMTAEAVKAAPLSVYSLEAAIHANPELQNKIRKRENLLPLFEEEENEEF